MCVQIYLHHSLYHLTLELRHDGNFDQWPVRLHRLVKITAISGFLKLLFVGFHMCSEVALERKFPLANVTLERLFVRMDGLEVCFKVIILRKCLFALTALKGPLACVDPFMFTKKVAINKSLVAHLAHKGPVSMF